MASIFDPDPKPTIADMVWGEAAYIVSWALSTNKDESLAWIDTHMAVDFKCGGTAQVKVKRTLRGYIVERGTIDLQLVSPDGEDYARRDPARFKPVKVVSKI